MPVQFSGIHNIKSSIGRDAWESLLDPSSFEGIRLSPGSTHHVELEAANYLTAFVSLRCAAEAGNGSTIRLTYSECYEDEPYVIPFSRRKGNRCDTTKKIIGPSDFYMVGGESAVTFGYHQQEPAEEVYQPFHYRAFRHIAVDIEVSAESELVLKGVDVNRMNYPLIKKASVDSTEQWVSDLWEISVRTLENCMHDCYEDCPFYEQLQYPMDTRSSSLFTYLVSGDDSLARQAIIQMQDSFVPSLGLITSRTCSGSMQRQVIPPFALYWIHMVVDHYEFYGDHDFARQFTAVCDNVLETFQRRIDPDLGLVRSFNSLGYWEYTDWTRFWVPQGVPPAYKRTGFSTYINCLYVYTLRRASWLLNLLSRAGVAQEYERRANDVTAAIQAHCFDGEFFTDGLAKNPVPSQEFSEHCQVWAVLAGAVNGERAAHILSEALTKGDTRSQAPAEEQVELQTEDFAEPSSKRLFTMTSISFKFYVMRALSAAGRDVYDEHFPGAWSIWKDQVAQGLSTWAEDSVTIRSDCHAWGSVPIYEFIVEVAGLKPATPGWQTISFTPRLNLFPKFTARVPVQTTKGTALVQVKWYRNADGVNGEPLAVELSVIEDGSSLEPILIDVRLPGREVETIQLRSIAIFEVEGL